MGRENILTEMPKRNPVNGTFELTVRCNLHCKMCLFRHDDRENPELIAKELTAEQWIDMARQAAEAGTFNLLITGGEPMLRPDFCEIWEGIYKQGFIIELYTNATLVTPKIIETLKKYPPHRLGITIYGACPETYQNVCGNKKAFEKMVDGCHKLLTLPSKITFRSTIIKENFSDLYAIQDFVEREFGNYIVENSRIVTKSVRGACTEAEKHRISPEDNLKVFCSRGIQKMQKLVGGEIDHTKMTVELCHNESEVTTDTIKYSLFGCDAGMSQYTITWDGKLTGCQIMNSYQIDAVKKTLKQAWDEYPYHIKPVQLNEICRKCELLSDCESCPATRLAETGDFGGYSSYVCATTHAYHKLRKRGGITL